MMASTIGPIDAGIVAALEEAYFKRTGVVVRHAGAGTGAALEMAKRVLDKKDIKIGDVGYEREAIEDLLKAVERGESDA